MNEHLSYEEKLKLGISYIDDELLIEAFDTDTREKLRKHCFSRKLFQKSIKALAACACFVLVIGGLMLG